MASNKEKAEATYQAIQKRKIFKEKCKNAEAKAFRLESIYRCMKLRHDRRN